MLKKNWYDIFTSWVCVMKNTENKMYLEKNVFNVPVWFNSIIRMNNNSVFFFTNNSMKMVFQMLVIFFYKMMATFFYQKLCFSKGSIFQEYM